jgi:hypothetical protein
MAYIDKTYVTWEQYKEVKSFFTKEMIQKQKNDIGYYFDYWKWTKKDFDSITHVNKTLCLWNTSSIVDMWLASYCKLDFIQERLHVQYPDNWIGWLPNIDFNSKGCIYFFGDEKSYVNLTDNINEEYCNIADKLIVYGSTYFFKMWNDVQGVYRGESYKIENKKLEVDFNLFGLDFEYKDSKYFVDGKEYCFGYFPIRNLFKGEKDKFEKFLPSVDIKYSCKKSEVKEYEPNEIIISFDNHVLTGNCYEDFSKENISRYLLQLPIYLYDRIK